MAFHTFKGYIKIKQRDGESYLQFYNRFLKPRFGLLQRSCYDLREDKDVYVSTSKDNDMILRKIGGGDANT